MNLHATNMMACMKAFLVIFALLRSVELPAQVAINNDGTAPHPSAQLEVKATNKGLLLPRVNPAAVANPAEGLLLYNSSNEKLSYRTGSGWANVASATDLYARFPNSIGYQGAINSSATDYTERLWVVPAGITSIWVEAWGGGDAGTPIPAATTTGNGSVGFSGGDAGDFASFLVEVTPGETITIRVGRGGLGSSTAVGGGSSAIITSTLPIKRYEISQSRGGIIYTGTEPGAIVPGLLQFIAGQDGEFSEISYAQSGPTEYRRIFKAGNGGDSYPGQRGGKGVTITYNAETGVPLTGGIISTVGKIGATPGAGGGASIGTGGSGGAGLVILHW